MLAAKPRSCYMFVLAVLRGSIGLQNAGHKRAGIWSAQSARTSCFLPFRISIHAPGLTMYDLLTNFLGSCSS